MDYVNTMKGCFDDAPTSTRQEIEKVILEEFGKLPEDIFSSFDPEPIASASLAQVHRAKTIDGTEVAVKVQHSHLRRMAGTETTILQLILDAIRVVHPEFGMQWLVDEMKEGIPKELNFIEEADNADKTRELLHEKFGDTVVIPRIYRDLSTSRVLTMSFEEGCKISEADEIKRQGNNPREVARLLSSAFSHLIFSHGFVHCDPHPGNVLVRRRNDKPQLVLLDHGLYRALDERLRGDLCELWTGKFLLIQRRLKKLPKDLESTADSTKIKKASEGLGIHSKWMDEKFPGKELSHTLIAAMLTGKEWSTIVWNGDALDRFDNNDTDEDHHLALTNHVTEYLHGILDVLETCPRDLLLVLKTNDALRSVTWSLGGLSVDTILITALSCIRTLMNGEVRPTGTKNKISKSWLSNTRERWDLAMAYARVRLFVFYTDVKTHGFVTASLDWLFSRGVTATLL
eukprot:CAMPEP_0167757500 /NCGR_PEP_ID=MMETSP0110_2-20121227/9960_1 /TAXON_ID=629695 /ORGANISM="Gymnochlora sp., Strain CCMP2014" /LENGTH=457 /DNA_ID=CAMNT_0007643697 /DNA_START=209 /DNA_END=1583 /DNA_ORIENTATION=+